MSGIYGYYLKNLQNTNPYDRALAFWNSVYGKNILCQKITNQLLLEVRLEHMSMNVPEQSASLDTPDYSAVIDALIYNRNELSQRYSLDLTPLSDEQLIFKIITEYGVTALANIDGDFAGVIYNKRTNTFTLFRDHMGVRPLFYYLTEDCFVFSTDMRALLAIPELNFSINDKYLFLTLTDQLVTDDNEFIFNEIHVVRYASWCTITEESGRLKVSNPTPYWKLGQHKVRLKNERAYQMELRHLVEESIKRRLDAVDGLIGAELSGGMDSSVIATLIHRFGREGRFFSWSSSPEVRPITRPNDERIIISAICKQENISVQYDSRKLNDSTAGVFTLLTPPYSNSMGISEASNWFHSQGVKAVFTGHGGDEGVSHRARPYELLYYKEYWAYFKTLYHIREKDGKKMRLLRSVRAFIHDIFSSYKDTSLDNDEIVLKDFLNPSYLKRISESCTEIPFTFGFDVIDYLQHGFHTNRPLNTAFQASAFGVRYLYPYLDHKVMDYAVSIPRWLYNNGIQNRRIYIEAFRDLMPEELLKYSSKHIPSMIPEETKGNDLKKQIEEVNKSFHTYVSSLNPEIWAPYLNLDKLNNYNIPKDSTFKELRNCAYRNNCLLYCLRLQRIWQHAIDPVLSAEATVSGDKTQ